MQLNYTPSEEDFINLGMFSTSQTRNVIRQLKSQRYIAWFMFLIICIISLYLYDAKGATIQAIALFSIGLILPFFSKIMLWLSIQKFKNNYQKLDKKSKAVNLSIDSENLILSNERSEFRFKTSYIERIIEVEKYYFIEVNKNNFLSISKNKVPDIQTELKEYASEYAIPYITKLDWVNNFYNKNCKI